MYKLISFPVVLLTVMMITFYSQATALVADELQKYVHEFQAMGVQFKVVLYAQSGNDLQPVKQKIQQRVEELESIFSNYRRDSEVSRLAENAPHDNLMQVSPELFGVLQYSNRLNQLTQGAFDPSIGSISRVWRFARRRNRMPDESKLAAARMASGWKNLVIGDKNQIALKCKGLQLDFGGIAKGFAADEIFRLLEKRSLRVALIEAGGDIRLGDPAKNDTGWKIQTPTVRGVSKTIELANVGVATSGSTQQHLLDDGKKYSHIIDPRNGEPVTHSWNVTVVAPDATAADALASAFSVLGKDASLGIANRCEGVFAMFIDVATGEVAYSDGFEKLIGR